MNVFAVIFTALGQIVPRRENLDGIRFVRFSYKSSEDWKRILLVLL